VNAQARPGSHFYSETGPLGRQCRETAIRELAALVEIGGISVSTGK
jgi:hypothetical protein